MLSYSKSFDRIDVCLKVVRKLTTTPLRNRKSNYYDVLMLKPNCSAKDIRNAFINLSKEFHPDKNQNDKKNHLRFVQLNEAYSILGRPEKRNEYDRSLNYQHRTHTDIHPPGRRYYTYADEQIFWKPEHSQTWADAKGKKNLSKSWIVFLCIVFTSLGVGLQVFAIRKSMTFSRDKLDELSEQNGQVLASVRKRAIENGNKLQLEIIRQRLEESMAQNNLFKKNRDD